MNGIPSGRASADSESVKQLLAPRFLPAFAEVPEAAWGMAPEDERLPVSSLGEPLLPWLRASAELPEALQPTGVPSAP